MLRGDQPGWLPPQLILPQIPQPLARAGMLDRKSPRKEVTVPEQGDCRGGCAEEPEHAGGRSRWRSRGRAHG